MSSFHPSELDSAATDSVASSPRSDIHPPHDPRVRFMCSFGGKILPRPQDNQLRYVGGDTRIVAVHRATSFSALLVKLSKLSGIANVSVKYQLPNEEMDALISVTTDEDVDNMMEEYDRVAHNQNPRSARLRLFLFSTAGGDDSRASSISSLLEGSSDRDSWFLDALNSGPRLERLRSEASSIVSEVPDYLFGFDNSDDNNTITTQPSEPKKKARPVLNYNVSASDPLVSSPYRSTSSAAPSIPDLPPVKTKPDDQEPVLQPKPVAVEAVEPQPSGHPMMHYVTDSRYPGPPVQQIPVYYVQAGAVPPGNVPVQIRAPYVPQYQVPTGQVPFIYHHQTVPGMGQVYGGPNMKPVMGLDPYEAGRVGAGPEQQQQQQVYYGVRNPSTGLVMPGGPELQRAGLDPNSRRISHST